MKGRLAAIALAIAFASLLYAAGSDFLTIAGIKEQLGTLRSDYAARPASFIAGFVLLQAAALALCLPGAVLVPTLAAGAIFGPLHGMGIALVAVTLGDSLGFLLARYVLRDLLARRLRTQIDRMPEDAGAATLLALRMMAVVPYFVVNIAMAMTPMKLRVFAPVSLAGLIPATFLYVHAGERLSVIKGASDIWTPSLLAIFTALGVLPLAARWAYRRLMTKDHHVA